MGQLWNSINTFMWIGNDLLTMTSKPHVPWGLLLVVGQGTNFGSTFFAMQLLELMNWNHGWAFTCIHWLDGQRWHLMFLQSGGNQMGCEAQTTGELWVKIQVLLTLGAVCNL